MSNDTPWPVLKDGMVRLRFTGGHLSGAVLDLPTSLSDISPGQLVITPAGVYDRDDDYRPIRQARILRRPGSTRPVHTPAIRSDYV